MPDQEGTMPIERQFTGADYNFRIEVEPCQSDTVRLLNQSQVSIFRDNVQINKIIERFVVPEPMRGRVGRCLGCGVP